MGNTLVYGTELTSDQRRDVLSRFVYRPTFENRRSRADLFGPNGFMATCRVRMTDAEWLATTEFAVGETRGTLVPSAPCVSHIPIGEGERLASARAFIQNVNRDAPEGPGLRDYTDLWTRRSWTYDSGLDRWVEA